MYVYVCTCVCLHIDLYINTMYNFIANLGTNFGYMVLLHLFLLWENISVPFFLYSILHTCGK